MVHGLDQQKAAVQSAYWPLFRYNPALAAEGKNPFQLDSRPPSLPLEKYVYNEGRYTMLARSSPGNRRAACSPKRKRTSTFAGSSTSIGPSCRIEAFLVVW